MEVEDIILENITPPNNIDGTRTFNLMVEKLTLSEISFYSVILAQLGEE